MKIVHINNINPELRHFLFNSRKIVLRNPFDSFSYRCYTKYFDNLYQYLTMVPNSNKGNKPVDFLIKYDGNHILAYILVGSFISEFSIEEYNKLYIEIEKLVGLNYNLYLAINKLEKLIRYYSLDIFSKETIEKMALLYEKFEASTTDNIISQFDNVYYQYYLSVENMRRKILKSLLSSEEKSHFKQFWQLLILML